MVFAGEKCKRYDQLLERLCFRNGLQRPWIYGEGQRDLSVRADYTLRAEQNHVCLQRLIDGDFAITNLCSKETIVDPSCKQHLTLFR